MESVFLLVSVLESHPLNDMIYGDARQLDEGFLASIQEHGILTPLSVYPLGDGRYQVVSGHRRLQAAISLGLTHVPCVILDASLSEREREYLLIHYNQQRVKTYSQRLRELEHLQALVSQVREYQEHERRQRGREQPLLVSSEADAGLDAAARLEQLGVEPKRLVDLGEHVGLSRGQTYRALELWEAAKSGDARAQELLGKVDRGETTLTSAHNELRLRKRRVSWQALESPPLPEGKFQIIYADPPWALPSFDTSRDVENHYPTMSLESIQSLGVSELAADDAVLFLWAVPMLIREAFEVMDAWGFEYRAMMVWVKDKWGTGIYVRYQHELLLIGVRGSPGAPLPEHRVSSVFHAERTRHSEKPALVYDLIEQMYPHLPNRVELFAREARAGWSAWGNQIGIDSGSVSCSSEEVVPE